MRLPEGVATHSSEEIISATAALEKDLEEAGYGSAHDWMFDLREIYYDVKRADGFLSEALNADPAEVPVRLARYVSVFLYQVLPHVQGHLTTLEERLPPPPGATEDDATSEEAQGSED